MYFHLLQTKYFRNLSPLWIVVAYFLLWEQYQGLSCLEIAEHRLRTICRRTILLDNTTCNYVLGPWQVHGGRS